MSSLQTGVFSGPVGSRVGQSRFNSDLVVRQAQDSARCYTSQYGLFELRAKAIDDPRCMLAASWRPAASAAGDARAWPGCDA